MLSRFVRAVYKQGHFIPLDELKLEENSRILIRILEEPEQPQGQTSHELGMEEKEEMIRQIMFHSGCTQADVENLFKTQGLWLDNLESEKMIEATQKGFEKWQVEEW